MNKRSAVEFKGNSRIHIGLNVTDLAQSRRFYELLLQTSPLKERSDYAKFEPEEPSVNLSLNQIPKGQGDNSARGHFGIQVQSSDAVEAAIQRFQSAGLKTRVQENTTCCYAVQDKVWVDDPDGNEWEVFVVLEADANRSKDETECCSPAKENSQSTACC